MSAFEDHFGGMDFSNLSATLNNLRASKLHLDRFAAFVSAIEKLTSVEGAARETAQRLDILRAEADAVSKIVAERDARQTELDSIATELERHRADADKERDKIIAAARVEAHDIVEAAAGTAAQLIADARTNAAAEAERQAAESRTQQAELDRLNGEITARRFEHASITQALADLRARIGASA